MDKKTQIITEVLRDKNRAHLIELGTEIKALTITKETLEKELGGGAPQADVATRLENVKNVLNQKIAEQEKLGELPTNEKAAQLQKKILEKEQSARNKRIEVITQAKKMGKPESELLAEGFTKAEIDDIYIQKSAPAVPAPQRVESSISSAVKKYIAEYNLETILPQGFEKLSEDQQLFIIDSLEKRIVNIVKSDAETQYSEYLKEKLQGAAPSSNLLKKIGVGIKNAGVGIVESVKKEAVLKEKETAIFNELRNTEEGKRIIAADLEVLTKRIGEQKISYDKTEGFIVLHVTPEELEDCTPEEARAIHLFNARAHAFKEIPYEWGQEKRSWIGGHKKKYQEAKEKYEDAQQELLRIKTKREAPGEKGSALIEINNIENSILMEQLLNTHPEFENALAKISDTSKPNKWFGVVGRTASNFLQQVTGGKGKYNNIANKMAFTSGLLLRGGTKMLTMASGLSTSLGLVTAPAFGALFGGIRGRLKAQETLQKNKEAARYGKTDESKEGMNFVNAADLSKRLEALLNKLSATQNNPDQMVQVGDTFVMAHKRMVVQGIFPDGTVSYVEEGKHQWKIELAPDYPEEASYQDQKEWLIKNIPEFAAKTPEDIDSDDIDDFEARRLGTKTKISTPGNGLAAEEISKEEMQEILEINIIDQIKRRIKYTKEKIEDGLVNFGDAKHSLTNQYNLINGLNNALTESVGLDHSIRRDVDARLSRFLEKKEVSIEKKQRAFVKKQMWQGAKIGAGAATFGYVLRWFGEEQGWWGNRHAENAVRQATENKGSIGAPIIETKGPSTAPLSPKLPTGETAQRFVEPPKPTHIDNTSVKTPHPYNVPGENIQETTSPANNTLETKPSGTALNPENKVPGSLDAKPDKNIIKPNPTSNTVADNSAVAKAAETARKIADTKAQVIETMKGNESGPSVNFAVTLGKDDVPQNLETTFNEMAADHLSLSADGVVDEQMATKSLNMAANMVGLSEGHNMLGIDANEFKSAVSFDPKTGVLEVKDHVKFNSIVEQLKIKADESWDKGILQSKGGAITYIPKINKEGWLNIMHAKGLVKTPDGVPTGIDGHPAVTLEKIHDFNESPLVKNALVEPNPGNAVPTPHVTGTEADQQLRDLQEKLGVTPDSSILATPHVSGEPVDDQLIALQYKLGTLSPDEKLAYELAHPEIKAGSGIVPPVDTKVDATANITTNNEVTQPNPNISTDPSDNGFTHTKPLTQQAGPEEQFKATTNTVLETKERITTGLDKDINDPRHLATMRDAKDNFGKENIITARAGTDTINNVPYEDWNTATDATFKDHNLTFTNYAEYEKERELQTLFGHGQHGVAYDSVADKNVEGTLTDYFRETEGWKAASKIPAKYFLDFNEARGHISEADMSKLIQTGVVQNTGTLEDPEYSFINEKELQRFAKLYEKLDPLNSKPIGDEPIEKYVARLTREIHKTNDGSLYVFKNESPIKNKMIDDGMIVKEERSVASSATRSSTTYTRGSSRSNKIAVRFSLHIGTGLGRWVNNYYPSWTH